ncbi:protein disulfide-isomerase 5-4-like [Vigna radiata var. radiata]|uniref:Protein disulfide-isomerase 5-4-like n=1 Tax=Vigna radiata var. radiata TaxID=3916 RepID=A0A1S3W1T2_VIGRR|nr:protein disulfide-isomerase 5-4-like [Vigna radiata var. radiata]
MISATELKSVDLYRLESLCSSFLFQLTSERAEAESLFSVTELEFVVLTVKLFEPCYLAVSASTSVIVYKSSDHYYLRNFNNSFLEASQGFASNDVSDVMETERINIAKTVLDSNSRPTGTEFRSGTVTNAVKHDDEVDGESDEGSFSLTTLNFDNYVNQFPITVVNFYVPWCFWSQRLKPAWEKTAKIMKHRYDPEIDGRIILAKVDCTLEADLCRRY